MSVISLLLLLNFKRNFSDRKVLHRCTKVWAVVTLRSWSGPSRHSDVRETIPGRTSEGWAVEVGVGVWVWVARWEREEAVRGQSDDKREPRLDCRKIIFT